MKSEVKALIGTLGKLSEKSGELTTKLKTITPEDEEKDDCELFCTLEDTEQEVDRLTDEITCTLQALETMGF